MNLFMNDISWLPQCLSDIYIYINTSVTVYNPYLQYVVSDIQTRAEGETLYVRYNTSAANIVGTCDTNGWKRSYSSKILEIGMILGEKINEKFIF